MNNKRTRWIASALILAVLGGQQPVWARGFGGGGFRGGGGGFRGGGGGFRGGGYGGGGFRGGGGYGGGGFGGGYGGFRGGSGGAYGGYRAGGGYGGARGGYGGGYGGYRAGGDNRFGVGNRADFGNRTNIGNRADFGNRTNIGNRTDFGNRTNIGNNVTNRANIGNNVGNRTNIGVNTGNINRNNINVNRGNNINVNNAGWRGGSRWGSPYSAYHSGWVHGYWNGHNSGAWGWRGGFWGPAWGFGAGLGLGWGLASWGFGSSLYNWGYMPYVNPYVVASPVVVQQPVVVDQQPVAFDYSQPIDTTAAAPEETVTQQAIAIFDDARAAFMQGNYPQALSLTDQALAKIPNDSALHEFRSLVLFALQRYDDAAAPLYAVLSVGPGWDWTTLISLYPNVDVYTQQLRALEAFCRENRQSASGRFVLAYQYLTAGHTDAAVDELRQVAKLKPDDRLTAQLVAQLGGAPAQGEKTPATATAAATATATATAAAPSGPPEGATIEGTWTAKPAPDTTIKLNVKPGGAFDWSVVQKGQTKSFSGESTFGEGLLTLAQENNGPVLVGRVDWSNANQMTFRAVGDGPEAPGLVFSK